MITEINGAVYRDMILNGAASIDIHKEAINELNVFPVPDGDTGTNMSLTMSSCGAELSKINSLSMSRAADVTASALLRGARGNSGVILSLLFRGMAKTFKGLDSVNTRVFAEGLMGGVKSAYKAVMKPTEGTILTVSRLMAEAAVTIAEEDEDFESLFEKLIAVGEEALADTINQNPVLKKAGVIDAGGKGYLCICSGMLLALRGEMLEAAQSAEGGAAPKNVFSVFETEDIEFAYDTVYIVRKTTDKPIELLRAYLCSIGDSLVISEDDDVFKVHVHTNIPGEALTESAKYGTLEVAKIENMRYQHDELVEEHTIDCKPTEPEKKYGVVAVCAGDGLGDAFKELGVDRLITGGQTMNPSTDDILSQIEQVPAEVVFVLPNNKNIIMAAQQCVPLTDKKVVVIETKTVPQGISAMYAFDDSLDTDELAAAMAESASGVHTVQITYAARDSEFDGKSIKSGEYLALLENTLIANETDFAALLAKVADSIGEFEPELITMFYGSDVDEAAAQASSNRLSLSFPDAEITLVNGGQPVYYYMIAVE
ncbi:MAG: DAK2 domain-containing protein [Oscillospiraceae bacterium]|nr:DAK2 domain-containing protein [Oscillospiraceae bacterium]